MATQRFKPRITILPHFGFGAQMPSFCAASVYNSMSVNDEVRTRATRSDRQRGSIDCPQCKHRLRCILAFSKEAPMRCDGLQSTAV